MRTFRLENAKNQSYVFTDKTLKRFFNSPTELGFTSTINTLQLGNVLKVTSEAFNFSNPSGELLFYNKGGQYTDYQTFMNFIRFEPLKFYYAPTGTDEYYCEGAFQSLTKTEISKDGILHIPFIFKATTHWRTANISVLELENGTNGDGKSYPLSYPYSYSKSNLANIEVNNNGSLPVGFVLEIEGDCTNPQFSVFDSNNVQYGGCKITGSYDYVKIDSIDGEESIYLENDDSVIANPMQFQDFSIADGTIDVTFVRLQVGKSYISMSLGANFDGTIRISWRNAYVSV